MNETIEISANYKLNPQKIKAFGFKEEKDFYSYKKEIADGEFTLSIEVKENKIKTRMTENETGEIYTLHLAEIAEGAFVGQIKEEFENIINEIVEKCYEKEVFIFETSKEVINYIKTRYNDELEFLWEKLPDAAIWRRKDTKKWYGVLMAVRADRLGLKSEEKIEVLNLHACPDEIPLIVDNNKYFRGYHMNKKHWISIIMNGNPPLEEISSRIDTSYKLAGK